MVLGVTFSFRKVWLRQNCEGPQKLSLLACTSLLDIQLTMSQATMTVEQLQQLLANMQA